MIKRLKSLTAILLTALILSQCSSSGDPGPDGVNGTDGKNSLIKISPESPGANCSTGGFRIDAGLDANVNGVLDPSEFQNTQYVCNGIASSINLQKTIAGRWKFSNSRTSGEFDIVLFQSPTSPSPPVFGVDNTNGSFSIDGITYTVNKKTGVNIVAATPWLIYPYIEFCAQDDPLLYPVLRFQGIEIASSSNQMVSKAYTIVNPPNNMQNINETTVFNRVQ